MNVYQVFRNRFFPSIDRCFIEASGHAPMTYGEADHRAAQFASAFRALGLREGDRVVAHLEKSPSVVLLYFACLRAGMVFVPVNHRTPGAELHRLLQDIDPALVISGLYPDARSIVPASIQRHALGGDGNGPFATYAAGVPLDTHIANAAPQDLAMILYTSGSTGLPKGVTWSHGFMKVNAEVQHRQWRFTASDVFLHAVPLFHSHGFSVAMNSVLMAGSRLRLLSQFDAERAIDEFAHCTTFSGVPTMYIRLLESPRLDSERCRGMRLFLSSSAALRDDILAAFERRTGHRIVECYGLTETGTLTSSSLTGIRKRGTVGRVLPGVDLRIVDSDRRTMPIGEAGHLEVRKAQMFSGYWRQPEETSRSYTSDDYFRTGDIAGIDAEGFVKVIGRSKDVIVTGGFNVYPSEIELAFGRMDSVSEAVAIGVPHPALGEAPIALVVAKDDADMDDKALLASLRDHLAPHKLPRRVFVVDGIPRAATGKVDVGRLRERYRDIFGTATV